MIERDALDAEDLAWALGLWRTDNRFPSDMQAEIRREKYAALLRALAPTEASIAANPAPSRQRKPRQPTLDSVAKRASKAGIEIARYELKPDGTIVIVAGKSESTEPNPWLDDLKVTKQ